MSSLNIFKHLLPRARAFNLTVNKQLRQFFEGLVSIKTDAKLFFDEVWLDIFPTGTRELDAFEKQFALPSTSLTEQERRDRLDAAWKALGGQSPRYIQDTLQAAGFDVFIHEWWEPGSNPPIARDPFVYIDDGTAPDQFTMRDGIEGAQDNDEDAQDGGTNTPQGYLLVNKIRTSTAVLLAGDGQEVAQDGDTSFMDGLLSLTFGQVQFTIPSDTSKFPFFLYFGGATFPDTVTLPESRRDEFEDLCLKICPTEQWLGLLIKYA